MNSQIHTTSFPQKKRKKKEKKDFVGCIMVAQTVWPVRADHGIKTWGIQKKSDRLRLGCYVLGN